MAKQFSYDDVHNYVHRKPYWLFDCGMVSSCRPIFDDCEDNYAVEKRLREAGVLRANTQTDTESCALVVILSSEKSAHAFIDRLNKYLADEFAKLPKGYESQRQRDRATFDRLARTYGW